MKPIKKWRFAIGTTSIVPETNQKKHYLIGDIDGREIGPTISFVVGTLGAHHVVIQPTKHGFHFFTNLSYLFKELCYILWRIPNIDPAWIGIGQRRGYFYLADKDAVILPWRVVRMRIHYVKKGR